jgi:large subunit ribosomal protein L4
MAAVASFTAAGTKSPSKVTLDKSVFGVEVKNHDLLKSAYVAYLANGRENLARTKTRGEVVGSTKKPWRQKGTGRARFGSRYNPIWRGGGITFGPTGSENYSKKVNVKAKRQAIRQALSLGASNNKIIVLDGFKPSANKTSSSVKLLAKLGANRNTLIVVENKSDELERSVRNLQKVKLISAKYINVFDALNSDHIIIEKNALSAINEWLGGVK